MHHRVPKQQDRQGELHNQTRRANKWMNNLCMNIMDGKWSSFPKKVTLLFGQSSPFTISGSRLLGSWFPALFLTRFEQKQLKNCFYDAVNKPQLHFLLIHEDFYKKYTFLLKKRKPFLIFRNIKIFHNETHGWSNNHFKAKMYEVGQLLRAALERRATSTE